MVTKNKAAKSKVAQNKAAFLAVLDSEDIWYEDVDDHVVHIVYSGENLPIISIFVFFNESGEQSVDVMSREIAPVRKEKRMAALRVSNEMNKEYRMVSFFVEGNEICAKLSYFLSQEASDDDFGELCNELVYYMLTVIDHAYPNFEKALLGKRGRTVRSEQ